MSDPYKVLGIDRSATDDEVKKAYREKSRKYHPDANINNPNKDKAEEMFKLVQQAYDQIMNERKYGRWLWSGLRFWWLRKLRSGQFKWLWKLWSGRCL